MSDLHIGFYARKERFFILRVLIKLFCEKIFLFKTDADKNMIRRSILFVQPAAAAVNFEFNFTTYLLEKPFLAWYTYTLIN